MMISEIGKMTRSLGEKVETLSFEDQGNLFSALLSAVILAALVHGVVS